ncbi:MAG: DUF2206 domain-containing protein, partial [Patescibacteria group bacterium]|nr:DUF2206 domain-containing protein [Patescibacteria group bacterium]
MLGGIALFVLLLTVLRDKIRGSLFAFSLFSMALSLLFMTSLRGWYITGHDIFLEYFVFQITKAQGIWQMSNFQDPYTACLSITILPTIISNITHINDLYIYKVIFQIIFSFSIVTTFIFIKRFVNPFFAFLGSFAIISLPTFMTDMPMLNRQEIALFFFALLLYTLFSKFSTKIKWILFFVFGIGLLLSHYSTTYISICLFIGGFLLYSVFRIFKLHPKLKYAIQSIDTKLGIVDNKQNLRLEIVVLLLIATVFWNVNITHTANGLMSTINNITKDFKTLHFAKQKSDPGAYGLFSNKTPTPQALLDNYIATTTQFVRKFNANSAFLDESIYTQY